MNPSWRVCPILATGLVTALVGGPSAVSQQHAAEELVPHEEMHHFDDTMVVDWVSVPVVVRSPRGYRDDLGAGKFHLFVDGREVQPDAFEPAAEAPFELAVLQDLSGSMAGSGGLAAGRRLLDCFLDRARDGDRFALASFGDRRRGVEVDFTGDEEVLRRTTATWEAFGITALHDAVADLHLMFEPAGGAAQRAVVLVTDGFDNASSITAAAAREAAYRARLPVYVVDIDPVADSSEDDTDPEALGLLATTTGGRYFPIAAPESAARVCLLISMELRHQYTLGFSTRPSAPESFHDITVQVAGIDRQEVIHRAGYYGRPPAADIH